MKEIKEIKTIKFDLTIELKSKTYKFFNHCDHSLPFT